MTKAGERDNAICSRQHGCIDYPAIHFELPRLIHRGLTDTPRQVLLFKSRRKAFVNHGDLGRVGAKHIAEFDSVGVLH